MNNANLKKNQLIILYSLLFVIVTTFIFEVIFVSLNLASFVEGLKYKSIAIFLLFLLQEAILLTPILCLLHKKEVTLPGLGLKKFKFWPSLGYLFLGFVAFFTINLLITGISTYFDFQIPGYGIQQEHLPIFGEDAYSLAFAIATLIFIAPLVEELVFRGFIYGFLRRNYGVWASILLSAFIFAIFHLEFVVFIPLFILGAIIAWIYEKTGSIWVTIGFHIINNSFAFALELMV